MFGRQLRAARPVLRRCYTQSVAESMTWNQAPAVVTSIGMGKYLKTCTSSATQMCTQPQFVMDPILQDAGLRTIQVNDVAGVFHLAKRKISGTLIYTGMFTRIWMNVTKHVYTDWVAKADADVVFILNRLRNWSGGQLVPSGGIYLEYCKYVVYGSFGNLVVFSKAAFMALVANIDLCMASPTINWYVGVKKGKYGPMGRDLLHRRAWM